MFMRTGLPPQILTYQGTPIMSKGMKELCKLYKIRQLQTLVYHLQTDGFVERFNHKEDAQYCDWKMVITGMVYCLIFHLPYRRFPRCTWSSHFGFWVTPSWITDCGKSTTETRDNALSEHSEKYYTIYAHTRGAFVGYASDSKLIVQPILRGQIVCTNTRTLINRLKLLGASLHQNGRDTMSWKGRKC